MTDDKELKQAIAELQEVVRCRCDEAYRDRGLKDPHCECDSAEAVKIVADHIKALTVESARRLALARSEGVARVEQFERNEALTEQLAAARKDAEEAEAYAEELEKERQEARAAWEIETATVKRFAERHTRHLVMGAEARDRAERAEAKLAKAVGLLEAWVNVAAHCTIEEGVCCCGDNMETHADPMDCGHSPVDHGAYIAEGLVEETNATLAELTGGKDE